MPSMLSRVLRMQAIQFLIKLLGPCLPWIMLILTIFMGTTFARAVGEQSPASDYRHADIFIQVATTIIFAITLIMTMVHWLYYLYMKNLKDDTAHELLSARQTASALLKDVSLQIQKHREAIQKEAEVTSNECEQLRADYHRMVETERATIHNAANAFANQFMELFSDRAMLKRLEIIRSKLLYELGDEKEKKRSIFIIGFMGIPDDIPFLAKIIQDATQSVEVRLAAQQAIYMIQQRYGGGGFTGPAQPTTPPPTP